MPRYVVTGGGGFIGYHVCRALLDRGDDVVIVDDLSDAPYPRAMKEKNLADLQSEWGTRIEFLRADVATDDVNRVPFEVASGVVHLAGLAGVRPSFRAPARYAHVNVEGTARVLERCYESASLSGTGRIVIASSSSVYGNSTPLPAREDATCVEPESPYAASKRACELVTSAFAKKMPKVTHSLLRFFTVYGPRQRPEMAITSFARAMLDGQRFPLFGDGSMRRDFTHVSDITRGILLALGRTAGGVRVFNLGSGSPVSLTELVSALEVASGLTARFVPEPAPLGDVEATFADITRAMTELGWSPEVRLEDGLRTVFDWLRDSNDTSRAKRGTAEGGGA
jgi:UDP-glucuronate 4-epimerase